MTTDTVSQLTDQLNQTTLRYSTNELLASHTTFRLGGPCPIMIHAESIEDAVTAVQLLSEAQIPYFLMGGGSNLLVADSGLDKVVIRFAAGSPQISQNGNMVTVSGNTKLDALAAYCASKGLSEAVACSGIPGTVGGAIAGNAGAFGWQIGDCVQTVRICDRAGSIQTITHEEANFSYRDSRLKHTGEIVLEAALLFTAGDPAELSAKREENLELRRSKHPNLDVDCCAGSFFRNIEPTSKAERRQAAGYFLEQAGAKHMRVGGAGLFAKHANIIVKTDDSCKSSDVFALHQMMKSAVRDKFGIELEPEVLFLGFEEEPIPN